MDKIKKEVEEKIMTEIRNGDFDKKENIKCNHICSGNCRRFGCNCECGEWHYHGTEKNYCKNCNAIIGDGHDCDNCSYCGTDN